MIFTNFIPLTGIDYPGKLATTIFTKGCNMRCSYCHNYENISCDLSDIHPDILKAFYNHIKRNKKYYNGVCISGGEPLLHSKFLFKFITELNDLGFSVKLDTNGLKPFALTHLLDSNLLDYVAMDIKAPFCKYDSLCNLESSKATEFLSKSMEAILTKAPSYEFRTTCLSPYISENHLHILLQEIEPVISRTCKIKTWYLQQGSITPLMLKNNKDLKQIDLDKVKEIIMASGLVEKVLLRKK